MPPPSLRCLLFICAISRSAHETLALNSQLEFLSELPSPRQEHSVAASGNSVYIAGGISSNYSFTPDTLDVPAAVELVGRVQAYDIESDTWTARHPLPRPINHGNIATVDSQIYLLGGLLGENLTEWGGIADSYVYNVDLDTWSSTTPLPDGTARGASAVSVYGENIYLAGGMRRLEVGPEGVQDSVSLVSAYNVRTGIWDSDLPALPGARDHVGGAVIGHHFYVCGGRDRGQFNVRGDTWALDLTNVTDGWQSLAPMPTPRGGLAAAAAGHCLYTFGGEGNPAVESGTFDNVEVYNVKTDSWKQLKPLWSGIHGTNAVTIGEVIYIPGGGYGLGASAANFTIGYRVDEACLM